MTRFLLIVFSPTVAILSYQKHSRILETQTPNQSIKLSTKYTIIAVLPLGLLFGLLFGLLDALILGWLDGTLSSGLLTGLIVGLASGAISGGDIVTKHIILRLILWRQGNIPWNYAKFLDHCVDRIFLRRVGGGYIFIHRMLMEHFASLTDEDIERIAREVEAGRGGL